MAAAARAAWAAGHLDGQRPLLTVSSNDEAAVLSAAVREDLIASAWSRPAGTRSGTPTRAGSPAPGT